MTTTTVVIATEDGKFGERTDPGNAGYDLRANEACSLRAGERRLIKIDLRLEMPTTMFAKIESRSGLALQGIDARGGVIDASYRGLVGVILHNTSPSNDFEIHVGDRIAQLLFLPILHPHFQRSNTLSESK
jgi:dUTP pyrophosphatase